MEMTYHGGNCCGVRHIYGMDNGTEAELQQLIRELDTEQGQGNRLIEIILSSRQVGVGGMRDRNPAEGWPAILQRNGFRLVSRFNNSNSRNDCYIFHRVPQFKSIQPVDLPFTWTHEDNPDRAIAAGGPGRRQAAAGEWRVGDIAVAGEPITSTAWGTHPAGTRFTVAEVNTHSHELQLLVRDPEGRLGGGHFARRFGRVVAPANPTVVATFYANWLTNNNRRGALHPTLEACRAAAPRCRRRDKLEIMSDGTQVWTENVREG